MMKGLKIGVVMVFQVLGAWGQQWEAITSEEFTEVILEMEKQIPAGASYGYEAKYVFFDYATSTDTVQVMDYWLHTQPKNKRLNMFQIGREIIQTPEVMLICDTSMNYIIVQPASKELMRQRMSDDFTPLKSGLFPTFKMEKGGLVGYRVEFPEGMQYNASEIWVNKSNKVKKYILFSAQEVLDDDGEQERMIQPRMEIVFTKFKTATEVDGIQLKTETKFFKDFKGLIPQDKYKDFEIIDLRIQE